MMWTSYFVGAMFGALLYVEFAMKLYSTIPVMCILGTLIFADVTAKL